MNKFFSVLAVTMLLLVSCSTKTPPETSPRPEPPDLPRTSPEALPHDIEQILSIPGVGKVEVDLMTNELILTTFRKGQGGMRINLFSDYSRVPVQSHIYDVVKVPLDDFKIYVITITADNKVGTVTFQLKKGKLYIW